MAERATSSDRWARDVSTLVREELARRAREMRAAGHDPEELGSPAELASKMLATVPQPSPWNALGPFYSTAGVCRLLGDVTRQAVEDRRRRRRLVALRTAEGGWVYPAFQFDERNRPIPAVLEAFNRLATGRVGPWSAAAILVGAQPELGGHSIAQHLAAGGDPADVEDLLAATTAALA